MFSTWNPEVGSINPEKNAKRSSVPYTFGVQVGVLIQNASEYGPTFLGIIKTLILVYVNLPSSISSIFCSLCHTQCDLFDSVVREHQEKRLCMLMSLNMPLEPGKRRGRRGEGGGGKKIYDMYITTIFFLPPPSLPTPPPVGSRI